jgi:hypothetical protein
MELKIKEKRPSFFSLRGRWGFFFILILLIGVIGIGAVLYAEKWLFREDLGMATPTRSYAHQVASELMMNIGEQVRTPSALFRWRSTGRWDEKPVFSQAVLFWFTYNTAERNYHFHWVNPVEKSREKSEIWENRLTPVIDSTLIRKRAGGIQARFKDDGGYFRCKGMIYPDEPKIVGMVTDIEAFRRVVLPELLEEARKTFPLLEGFTIGPEKGSGNSPLFILARDRRDSVIAQLGVPGAYADREDIGKLGFKKAFPYMETLGFSLEIVIPRCIEVIWLWYLTRGFYLLIIVWFITMIFWAKAEFRLRKALKKFP